jgi:hypothetical protein
MRKSVLSIVIIVFVVSITVLAIMSTRSSLLLKNTTKFPAESKGLSIALIKPTFTAAAYHASFYRFYIVHSTIPLHARKNIT